MTRFKTGRAALVVVGIFALVVLFSAALATNAADSTKPAAAPAAAPASGPPPAVT